jgi:molybdopterin adenylyltransferase
VDLCVPLRSSASLRLLLFYINIYRRDAEERRDTRRRFQQNFHIDMIRAVVITVSDACSRGEREDTSGAALVQLLTELGAEIVDRKILSDDLDPLVQELTDYAQRDDVNLIITTGGTGLGPRDNTPEATQQVIEREAPGIAEAIRVESLKATPMAMLSRAVCGVRSGTLIINVPGSPKAVRESFAVVAPIIPHAINLLAGRTKHDK